MNRAKQIAAMLGLCGISIIDARGVTPEVNIAGGPILGCRGAGSGVALSGISPSDVKASAGDAFVYQPGFDVSKWSGSLRKLRLVHDELTSGATLAPLADWDAGEVLTGVNGQSATPAPEARNILTAKVYADGTLSSVQFKWGQLSAEQKVLLNMSPVTGKDDGLGEKRLDFLRGVRSLEIGQQGGIFRQRDRLLGDIVNGNPTYVGAPAADIGGAEYQKFFDENKHRGGVVYVGANDGMLHGFSAADGRELFAYVPNALIQAMPQLSLPGYLHRPYVDGALSVGEARVGGAWKTILVSGMGGGAQGLFALDVTNPSKFGSGLGVLMEFTDRDDAAMGNVTGPPLIAKFKTKVTKGVPEYQYFVVAASGLNNYRDDGPGKFDAAAPGALFLFSLDKAPAEKWLAGVNYFKFKMPIQDASLQNGLSTPVLVAGSDGAVRFAYAGDLQGNLWRLDFSGLAPWSSALLQQPVFTAMDANKVRQPISVQPKVVFAPGGGNLLLFGTGKLVEYPDAAPANFKMQSFYGIYDSTETGVVVAGRSELMARTLKKVAVDGFDAFSVIGAGFSYGASGQGKKGWYFDFPESDKTGERMIAGAISVSGSLLFNSVIPGGDACTAEGRSYLLDVLSGLTPSGSLNGISPQIGLMSSPVLLSSGLSQAGERNALGQRSVKAKFTVINFGTGGAKGSTAPLQQEKSESTMRAGRLSWREVLNWQELRDAIVAK
jgi:type IV pilus assembly protein PilY1